MKYEVEVLMPEHEIRRRYVDKSMARRYFNTSRDWWGKGRRAYVVLRDLTTGEILAEFKEEDDETS